MLNDMSTRNFIQNEINEKTEEIYSKSSPYELEAYARSEKKTIIAVFSFLILFIGFLGVFCLLMPQDSLYALFLTMGIVFCCICLGHIILMFYMLKAPHEILAKRQIKRRLVNNPETLIINTENKNKKLQEVDLQTDSAMDQKKKKLQELKKLLDDGLITQEDYEQKKKQIIGL